MEQYHDLSPEHEMNAAEELENSEQIGNDEDDTPSARDLFSNPNIDEKLYDVKNNMPVERTTNLQPKDSYSHNRYQRANSAAVNIPITDVTPPSSPLGNAPQGSNMPQGGNMVGGSRQPVNGNMYMDSRPMNRPMNPAGPAAAPYPQGSQGSQGSQGFQNPQGLPPRPNPNNSGYDIGKMLADLKDKDKKISQLNEKIESIEKERDEYSKNNEELTEQVEQLEANNEMLTKRVDILKSDWDNYRKRTEENREKDKTMACESIVKSLLLAIDDLERSIEYSYQYDTDADSLVEGNKAILRRILNILADYGVTIVEASGDFDANVHCAISREKDEDLEPGTIVQVVQTGYMLGDKVLRPASVIVSY